MKDEKAEVHWRFEMKGDVGILTQYGDECVVQTKEQAGGIFHQIPLSEPEKLKKGEKGQWLAASRAMFDSDLPE